MPILTPRSVYTKPAVGGVSQPLWSDTFDGTGAYSDPDTTTPSSVPTRASGQLSWTANYAQCILSIDGPTFSDNQYIIVEVHFAATDNYEQTIRVNCTNNTAARDAAGSGYSMNIGRSNDTGNQYLNRDGVYVHDFGADFAWSLGDKFELRRVNVAGDAVISFYINDVKQGTDYTDTSPLSGGNPLYRCNSGEATVLIDNASAGDDT